MRRKSHARFLKGKAGETPQTYLDIKERTNMNTIISKEEALRRLVATKESKRQRIAVLKERMKEKYVNSMGVEPENILFL